jgi:D-sedoheptulose 7-phosphate isomerase
MKPEKFSAQYIKRLIDILSTIDHDQISRIIEKLIFVEKNKSRVYLMGNGGSSATASHMANDLGAGLRRRDVINLDVMSLADNTPVITAISNDIGYENIFYMQLVGLLKKEDLIIAISCSGNSINILKAVDYAKEVGSCIIAITGFDGGKLKNYADINFHVATNNNDYGLVEDTHMILDHIIYSYFIECFKKNEK